MPTLYNADTSQPIGTISDSQLRFLVDHLEEESSVDRDYFMDGSTIDLLEQNGADAALVKLLRDAVGSGEGIEIRWTES